MAEMAVSEGCVLSEEVESQLGDLTTACVWWKEHILSLLGVVLGLSGAARGELVRRLAGILMCSVSRVEQAAAGLKVLMCMPALYEEVVGGSTFDVDMLATIAAQVGKFEEVDFVELEEVLRGVVCGSSSMSPGKLRTHIRTATYSRCVRKASFSSRKSVAASQEKEAGVAGNQPALQEKEAALQGKEAGVVGRPVASGKYFKCAPPRGLSVDCYPLADPAADAMVFDPVTSTCVLRFACSSSGFNLMKRLVEDYARERRVCFEEALMRLVSGGKRPRINLYAIGVPGGRLLVEGRGWINTGDLSEEDVLLVKNYALTPNQLAELFIGNTSLDSFAA